MKASSISLLYGYQLKKKKGKNEKGEMEFESEE